MWKNVYNYNYSNKDCVKPLFIIIYIRIFMSFRLNINKKTPETRNRESENG